MVSFRKVFILILLFTLNSFSEVVTAFGYSFDDAKLKNPHIVSASLDDKMAYSFVRETCDKAGNVDLVFNLVMRGAFEMARTVFTMNAERAKSFYERGGVSPFTRLLLDSMGLHIALNECFGDSSFSKGSYVMQLIAADMEGTAAGIGVNLLGGRLIFSGLKWVVSKVISVPIYLMIKASKYNTRLNRYIFAATLGGGLGASSYYSGMGKNENEKELDALGGSNMDYTLQQAEESLLLAYQSAQASKGTAYFDFWKKQFTTKLNEMNSEIQRLRGNNQLSAEQLQNWKVKYTKYTSYNLSQ